MYSPYLYARQSELLALRSLLSEGKDLSKLLPIIEPVVTKTSGIVRCIDLFAQKSRPIIIVVNPDKHEFKVDPRGEKLGKFTSDCTNLFSSAKAIPAYKVSSSTSRNDIDAFLRLYKSSGPCLIYESPSLSDSYLGRLASDEDIRYHILINNRISSGQAAILPSKKLIDVRDYFNKQDRNADYGAPEFFTSHHNNIGQDFASYGDFTIIGDALEIGGGKPAAVAIHLTYKRRGRSELWVEHFVSDDIDRNTGTAASKFLEAVDKGVAEFTRRRPEFGNDFALSEYERHQRNRSFPQLGKNKELQIHHHIRLVLDAI
ncbi:sce7725 family protein [Dyella sp. BiH032]|uniref:sce7725 family protein n=1 Tax=Dyella sp. BiH032 TaxID=3075430 RepID=UPI0028929E45|nr:sce7725 family protein [Dyella sp. BiH032]WNL45793.1 sce7725 family protein [Dyella sp. BiH032]